jgi:sn-glycerol 3-phosphate transport system permease protein
MVTVLSIGFAAIIYLAALQGLPAELYEAARLDGAGSWTQFRRITVPLLSPISLFLLIITTLSAFRAYEVTAILTDGGPGISSTTLTWYIYKLAFTDYNIGHATAASVILFLILIGITYVQVRSAGRKVHYQ